MKFTTGYPTLARILFGVSVLSLLPSVKAASPECAAGWEWSYNSKGQNPCEVAGSLQAGCLGVAVYELPPLSEGEDYVTPQRNDSEGKWCECNTIIYSLYIACSICQKAYNSTPHPWGYWAQYCDSVYVAEYPFDIPYNTSVPHWAYLDDRDSGFNATRARATGRDPEATPSSTSGGGDNSGGSKTNIGVIAGSVVGGVVALAALAVLAFFFKLRLGRVNAASVILEPNPLTNPNMTNHIYAQPKSYDPAGPSTIPRIVSGHDSSHLGAHTSNPYQPGRYNGAAEL